MLEEHVALGCRIHALGEEFENLTRQCHALKKGVGSVHMHRLLRLNRPKHDDAFRQCVKFPLLFQNTMNQLLLDTVSTDHQYPLENVYFNVPGPHVPRYELSIDENITESDILTIEKLIELTVDVMDDCVVLCRRDGLTLKPSEILVRDRDRTFGLIDKKGE
jgi:hypothetical protein